MNAIDVMIRDVVTIGPDNTAAEAAKLLAEHDVSALPVLDAEGNVIGIVGEPDLLHGDVLGVDKRKSWWVEAAMPASTRAADRAMSRAIKVSEIMYRKVVSATENTPVSEIASLLERHRIKRVPILRGRKLVGIVSRSNLLQALASYPSALHAAAESDRNIRLAILEKLSEQPWTDFGERNVVVSDGVVHLWGLAGSEDERKALIDLAKNIPGVRRVADEMTASYWE